MEIEAKFVIPTRAVYRRLRKADTLAGYRLSPAEIKHVRDAYLDTAQRAIEKAGYACRKRVQDNAILITLKQLLPASGALHRREEIEMALANDQQPSQWPAGPVRDRVLQWIGQDPLVKRFELSQSRHVRLMSSPQAWHVAELSLDEVRLSSRNHAQVQYVCEVELLPQGNEQDLAEIQHCLQQEWGLLPEPQSKYERALALVNDESAEKAQAAPHKDRCISTTKPMEKKPGNPALMRTRQTANGRSSQAPAPGQSHDTPDQPHLPKPPKNPGVHSSDTVAEGIRKTLLFHLKRMVHHERGTRLGEDIEELHDMRVATRRMRAAIKIFADHIDMSAIKPFAKELRRVGRTLGAVRDLDVFKHKAGLYLENLPPERRNELDPLVCILDAELQQAREKMLLMFDSGRYHGFKKQFAVFLKKPGATSLPELDKRGMPRPRHIRLILPAVLYQHLAAVRAYEAWINGPDVSLEHLHQLRIAFKGLRYTLEFFREVLHPDALKIIEAIKGLQDHLGNLQDAVVTCSMMRDFLTWGTWGHGRTSKKPSHYQPVIAPGVASYLSVRQTELQRLVETFPPAWARLQHNGCAAQIATIIQALL
jgi:CHAD domain-containing protein